MKTKTHASFHLMVMCQAASEVAAIRYKGIRRKTVSQKELIDEESEKISTSSLNLEVLHV
jgi:hypothetical protein